MALKNYGVLKGRVVEMRFASGSNPHYQIRVVDEADEYRIAVNVQSQDGSEVMYAVVAPLKHPLTDSLSSLPLGWHLLPKRPDGGGLDYIRGNLFDRNDMVPLPLAAPGPDNDLNEKLDHYVQRALGDEEALVYAFGERWGPENKRDKIFGFAPGNGVHDIHMNQGNDGQHKKDNGVWQDGGLVFHFPLQDQWVAVFLKFQTQAWHTDDQTGHPILDEGGGPPSDSLPVEPPPGADRLPTTTDPDGLVRIVAALVNDTHSPEHETVTILNTSPASLSLDGWSLADKQKNRMPLNGPLGAGQCRVIEIAAPVALSNKGGIITLLNDQGLKVDGVAYTKAQVRTPGWTIVFR